jgi:hypothetical protein
MISYRCYWDRKLQKLVEVPVDREPPRQSRVQIMRDLPAYKSPLGDGVIEGRAARREHLKRNNCREVEPSEWKGGVRNHDFAKRWGVQPTGDPLPKPRRLPTTIDRNWRE